MTQERATRVRAASAGEGGRQMSRWTVQMPIAGRDPDGVLRPPFILNSIRRMPVADAVADEAVEANQTMPVELAGGWAEVVPEPIFRAEWLHRGGPPDQGALMCVRDDNACVYVVQAGASGATVEAEVRWADRTPPGAAEVADLHPNGASRR
jgi:hypothetical protein